MDESRLIELAQSGDRVAFEALSRGRYQRIYWTALQVVGNTEDAQDVTQAVLIRLWRVLPQYDAQYSFSTWLYRIIMNLGIDHLRRESRHRHDPEPDAHGRLAADPSQPGPYGELAQGELQRVFLELAEELPPQQRTVFVLRELEDRSTEEVMQVLGVSASTVRNHLFQARKTLRKALVTRYPEYLPARLKGSEKA